MPYLFVRHKVADFARWKPVFDSQAPLRQEAGSEGGFLFRTSADPNEVVVILKWAGLERAKEFAQSQDLRDTMIRGGVSDPADIYFLVEEARIPF